MAKYSVIVPVYNAEKTLNRCIGSLISQERSDIEVILVNDGSKDGSVGICEEYVKNHPEIRLISKQNGGVSSARNAGLDEARGEYVIFVDSDDRVAQDLFLHIDGILNEHDADLIQLSSRVEKGDSQRDCISAKRFCSTREELIPVIIDAICSKRINGPWAKVYKRDLIEAHGIRFPVGASVGEDRVFNIIYSLYIGSLYVSDVVGYVINTENENSLSRKRHNDLQQQFDIADSFLDSELAAAPIGESEKQRYREAINFGICRTVYHEAKLMIQDGKSWLSRQKSLFGLCKNNNRKHMKYPKTRYCTAITLPIRLYMTPVIDAVAWKLVHNPND